ncbi:MAG: triphosphoribosyl-dephospho-CoA synthase [Planctomycetaceae bacterium]|jgi:triphosphoribosyl-dephospho-CoA synthase|nr:triphosphoribosyl-dephospho-CoA synthase [bacterium]MDC0307900.1 triphosphoribosyl-dephospho-CoA synthase [Planctomycetaceae bacterium]MDG2388799.1 triphosphoribosyl-dephospho-CoA synthase [Planctomycetaceae bacterium]
MDQSDLHTIHPITRWVRYACLLEVCARKPGNVHREKSFEDLDLQEFIKSAEVIAPLFEQTEERGVGPTILEAVKATQEAVGKNTNLGMILLLAPLTAVPLHIPVFEGIGDVLANLTVHDSRCVYEAIRLAAPGGMGEVSEQDVQSLPTLPLMEVMALAKDRDNIALQYTNEFDEVLHYGLEQLATELGFVDRWENSIIHLHLKLMTHLPDSLIARKCGQELADEASLRARTVLESDWPDYEFCWGILSEFDDWLRADGNRRNPGTTADFVVACLYAGFREGIITPPPMDSLPL